MLVVERSCSCVEINRSNNYSITVFQSSRFMYQQNILLTHILTHTRTTYSWCGLFMYLWNVVFIEGRPKRFFVAFFSSTLLLFCIPIWDRWAALGAYDDDDQEEEDDKNNDEDGYFACIWCMCSFSLFMLLSIGKKRVCVFWWCICVYINALIRKFIN